MGREEMRKCGSCGRMQATGDFCMSCGRKVKEISFNKDESVKFKKMDTSRGISRLKEDAIKWLLRINVQESDINFVSDGQVTTIEYILEGKKYQFSSFLQDKEKNNWAAVEQFLHHRIIGIERGIESKEKAFEGYEALPDYTVKEVQDPYQVLGFEGPVDIDTARERYREQAKKYHPDVNKEGFASEQFSRIKKAMDTIVEENE